MKLKTLCLTAEPLQKNTEQKEYKTSNDVIPDKDSLPEELLDDLPVIAEFHTSAMNLDDEEIVSELFRKAENELKESFQAYLKEKQKQ